MITSPNSSPETHLQGRQGQQSVASEWLCNICLEAGADDVGVVEIDRPEIADQRQDLELALPGVRTLLSFVCRLNREPIRTPLRSVANLEFHHAGDKVNEVARKVVTVLEEKGIRALNPAMGFPMEMDRWPGKLWVVSHKPVAAAAGLGKIGIHRNLIHPKFGNFVLLGTVLIDAEVDATGQPLVSNPCLECKLCVAACPTGAISPDGQFDFSACYTHNYREFMGGFTDWVENIADSKSASAYRERVTDPESVSMWQSLSYGANYKAAYCMSVCPAGDEIIRSYQEDKPRFVREIVRPLQEKDETIYVTSNSDAEVYVAKRLKSKRTRRVGNSLRPQSISGFLSGMPLTFQRQKSAGLEATYHFRFTGQEHVDATVRIADRRLAVSDGHQGQPDLTITADSRTWLKFLAGEQSIILALLTFRIRVKGKISYLPAFGRCFPN